MCGIYGTFGKGLIDEGDFRKVNDLNLRRGPDSDGYWTNNNNCQLGFRRLAIQDTSANGNQPMQLQDGRYTITFNGEIYNHHDLQHELGLQAHQLKSTSDTEVMLHAFEKWGVEKTAQKLNGIFAIALYDKQANQLFLIRDFAGVKPLFFAIAKNRLFYASQFNQITESLIKQNISLTKSSSALYHYMMMGYMQAPETIYEEVRQVMPGQYWVIDADGNAKAFQYWQLPITPTVDNSLKNENEVVEKFEDVFGKCVKDQLVSDVPLGMFLSGGIDSPLVSAHANQSNKGLKAFTIGVQDPKYNESEFAKKYAEKLGIDHVVIPTEEKEIIACNDDHFKHLHEPFADYSSLPTYLVCQKSKAFNTVMLSGDGGDELFWGYERFNTMLEQYHWFNKPKLFRKPIAQLSRKMGQTVTYAVEFTESLFHWQVNQHAHNRQNVVNDWALQPMQLQNEVSALYYPSECISIKTDKELFNYLRWNEFNAHMQRVLIKVDRMSMANSLEVRVPFLDKQMIDFAWSLNDQYFLHKSPKQILKKALAKHVGQDLVQNKKMGFSVPIDNWLRTIFKEELMDIMVGQPLFGNEMFDEQKIKKFVTDFVEGKNENSWGVWIVYALQKWKGMQM
jgi:asparagine synthase (glutamine-hydrolysing)